MPQHPLSDVKVYCRAGGDLTFHPVRDELLSLLGGAPGEPVVSEQSRHLVGVHQLPWHEGQRAKRHLFRCNRRGGDQCKWRNEGYGRKVCRAR